MSEYKDLRLERGQKVIDAVSYPQVGDTTMTQVLRSDHHHQPLKKVSMAVRQGAWIRSS